MSMIKSPSGNYIAQRYNTGNQRPSNSMKDLNDNVLAYDDFINGEQDVAYDRFQKPFPTVRKQVEDRIDELVGASQNAKESAEIAKSAADNAMITANLYPSLDGDLGANAAIAAGTIPNGAIFFVRSTSSNSISDEYQNIAGVSTATGKSHPTTAFVAGAYDHVDDIIQNYPDSAISLDDIAAAIEGEAGKVAPYMNKKGEVGFIDDYGKFQKAAYDNSLTERLIYQTQDLVLSDGAICRKVNVDESGRIIEAWTYDGGYYLASESQGLVRVGGDSINNESAIVYATGTASIVGMENTRLSVDSATNVCYIFFTWGQSLAQGYNEDPADTLTAVTPLFPSNCFMFTGARPGRGSTAINTLVPLKEAIVGGLKETAASSLASHVFKEVQTVTGQSIRTLSFVAAEGGKAFRDLTKGTPAWQAMIQGFVDAKNICIANGWTPVVVCADVMAGETDSENVNAMTVERYKRQIQQFDADVNSEVKRITKQESDVRIIVSQSAFTPAIKGLWDQPVRQAQYDLDGVGNIRLSGPVYPFPYGDVIHINSLGQNRRGQMVSRAALWDYFGTGWRPIKLASYLWRSPTVLTLIFDVPKPPLVLDTSGEIITVSGLGAGLGFVVDDRTSTPIVISSVALAGNSVVDITLASAPVNPAAVRVGYAIKRNDGNTTQDGPVVGARGCLRDSTNHISLYDGVANHNWMPAFIKEVPF